MLVSLARAATLALFASMASAAPATRPAHVTLSREGDAWRLLRDGEPYFIKGAGGNAAKSLLANVGGNSFRTWGVGNDTPALLDEAQRLGLTVTLGIWLKHAGDHGFSYANPAHVGEQYETARRAIEAYKDHPALLCWAIGNEMEGFKAGDDPNVWRAVQAIAALAKKVDPNHPTMTVIAEVGGARVRSIHALCTDVDIVGINSYGGAATVGERYRKAGGTKPFVVTEFGPPGPWEVAKNAWGAPLEPTSTRKGEIYRQSYLKGVLAHRNELCLGSYAFTWGSKQETTATWFGMLLPDATQLEAVHVMSQLWTGKPLPNACPKIEVPSLDADDVAPGQVVHAKLVVSDPDGDPPTVRWELAREAEKGPPGGLGDPPPPNFPNALADATSASVTVTMPAAPGIYRLFAYAKDDHGNGAVANVPIRVGGGTKIEAKP